MNRRDRPFWMPLHIAEFIADTTHLTAAQGWAYINMLCAMWRSDDGTLPNDAATLARVGKVGRKCGALSGHCSALTAIESPALACKQSLARQTPR